MRPWRSPWTTTTASGDDGGSGAGATVALGSPTEKVREPEIGWPSVETTYQPTT